MGASFSSISRAREEQSAAGRPTRRIGQVDTRNDLLKANAQAERPGKPRAGSGRFRDDRRFLGREFPSQLCLAGEKAGQPAPDRQLHIMGRRPAGRIGIADQIGGGDIIAVTAADLVGVARNHPPAVAIEHEPCQQAPHFGDVASHFSNPIAGDRGLHIVPQLLIDDGLLLSGTPRIVMAGLADIGAVTQQIEERAALTTHRPDRSTVGRQPSFSGCDSRQQQCSPGARSRAVSHRWAKAGYGLPSSAIPSVVHMTKTVLMDEQTLDLIRQLCTRIGMIMEDEAETALIWNDEPRTALPERLDQLNQAGASITRLAEAAMVLLRRAQV